MPLTDSDIDAIERTPINYTAAGIEIEKSTASDQRERGDATQKTEVTTAELRCVVLRQLATHFNDFLEVNHASRASLALNYPSLVYVIDSCC